MAPGSVWSRGKCKGERGPQGGDGEGGSERTPLVSTRPIVFPKRHRSLSALCA